MMKMIFILDKPFTFSARTLKKLKYGEKDQKAC